MRMKQSFADGDTAGMTIQCLSRTAFSALRPDNRHDRTTDARRERFTHVRPFSRFISFVATSEAPISPRSCEVDNGVIFVGGTQ